MKKVVFVFDRVAHYHRELFATLDSELQRHGLELHLLSGVNAGNTTGRLGLANRVIANERKYRFHEHRLGSYIIRRHSGVHPEIERLHPDLVVFMSHVGNLSHWLLRLKKKALGFKLVAWQCGYEYNPGRIKDVLLTGYIKGFDHHLAYHSNARAYAMKYGARADQVTVIHNTINEQRIALLPKKDARALLLERHPEIGDRRIVLFVGAVLAEKRINVILEALDLLRRSDVVLVLVGDGEYMPIVRNECEGRTDVVLAGAIVEGVGPYFDAADMYVLPGTGGLGINEAMAHRLPIVSGFADGSADDLVVDGENGFRLRHGTAEELAEKIAAVLDNSELAKRMGEKSRESITGKFAFQEFVGRITHALVSL